MTYNVFGGTLNLAQSTVSRAKNIILGTRRSELSRLSLFLSCVHFDDQQMYSSSSLNLFIYHF